MTYEKRSHPPLLVILTSTALSLFGLGCGDNSGGVGGGSNIDLDAGRPSNVCISVRPPLEDPDLVSGPTFPSDPVNPGTLIEGDIFVDGETRTVTVEVVNIWELGAPPIGSETVQTGGNQSLSFSFPTDFGTLGRFFFRITLCAGDCDARRVVFTVVEDPDNPNERNDPYQRIAFEGDTEVDSRKTCLEPDSIVVQ